MGRKAIPVDIYFFFLFKTVEIKTEKDGDHPTPTDFFTLDSTWPNLKSVSLKKIYVCIQSSQNINDGGRIVRMLKSAQTVLVRQDSGRNPNKFILPVHIPRLCTIFSSEISFFIPCIRL